MNSVLLKHSDFSKKIVSTKTKPALNTSHHPHSHTGSEHHTHHDHAHHDHSHSHEHKTKLVIYLSGLTMMLEITFGYYTNSMALLADGWHMSSHVFVLGLAWIAYFFTRKVPKIRE